MKVGQVSCSRLDLCFTTVHYVLTPVKKRQQLEHRTSSYHSTCLYLKTAESYKLPSNFK